MFIVSVASKGFSLAVSLLIATFAGRPISVAAKGLMGAKCGDLGDTELGRVCEGGRGGKPPIGISVFPEVPRGSSVGFTRHVSTEVTCCQVKLKSLKKGELER